MLTRAQTLELKLTSPQLRDVAALHAWFKEVQLGRRRGGVSMFTVQPTSTSGEEIIKLGGLTHYSSHATPAVSRDNTVLIPKVRCRSHTSGP